jgi:hypothetical protein
MSFLLLPLTGALLIIRLACLVLVVAALLDAASRPSGAFDAADKLSKGLWLGLLIVGLFIWLVGIVAAIVYLTDVRPAVRAYGGGPRGGGSRGGGSSSDGPYGPYRG